MIHIHLSREITETTPTTSGLAPTAPDDRREILALAVRMTAIALVAPAPLAVSRSAEEGGY